VSFLSSPSAKNILIFRRPKSGIYLFPSPPNKEGRFAIVTNVGLGMRWTRMAPGRGRRSRTEKSCGPDTLTPVSSWRRQTADDGGKRAGLAGESTKETVKPLRAGMLGDSGGPVVINSCVFYILHARLWVHWAPGIPHALCWAELNAKLGRIAPRECDCSSLRGAMTADSCLKTESEFAPFLPSPGGGGIGGLRPPSLENADALHRLWRMK
jgi:hypothetical protein